ncbi:MAG: carbohydrate kinase family protein [Promethearchaeota archaeon]
MQPEKPVQPVDLVFCGHFALDRVVYGDDVTETLGGGVTFGSAAARSYSPDACLGIVSVAGEDFKPEYEAFLRDLKVDLRGVRRVGGRSTRYVLTYHDGGRDLQLAARAPDLDPSQVPDDYYEARAFMLGPICNEVPPQFVRDLAARAPDACVGMDVQGFIRHFDPEGKVYLHDGRDPVETVLSHVDLLDERLVLKASDAEAEALTGKSNPYEALRDLCRNDAVVVVTRGEKGSLVGRRGQPIVKVPAFVPERVLDETGAGDAYMAGFMLEYACGPDLAPGEGGDLRRAALVGAAVASFLIEEKGPRGVKGRDEVLRRVAEQHYIDFQEDYR